MLYYKITFLLISMQWLCFEMFLSSYINIFSVIFIAIYATIRNRYFKENAGKVTADN